MYSALPRLADVARSAFHYSVIVLRITRSGSEQFHARLWLNNATRLSGMEWLCSAQRACVWSRCQMTPRRSQWSCIRRWRARVTRAWRNLYAVPAAIRILAIAAIAFLGLFATNLVYHVLCKPTEM